MRRRFHPKAFIWAVMAYAVQATAVCSGIWAWLEPNSGTNQNLMADLFGPYWRFLFYGSALLLGAPTAYFVYWKYALPKFLRQLRDGTNKTAARILTSIAGTGTSFKRNEVANVLNQLPKEPVLLVGEGGTGKSAIALELVRSANSLGFEGLLIDAREVQHRNDEAALRQFYSCDSSLSDSIGEIGRVYGVRLIIDQIDSVITQPIAGVLVDLAARCSRHPGVEVVVVSRRKEEWEHRVLEPLVGDGFVAIPCRAISIDDVDIELERLDVHDAPVQLREACRNLLNLDLLSRALADNPALDVSALDETGLWEAFFQNLRRVEEAHRGPAYSDAVWNEAVTLARTVILSGEQYIRVQNPSEHTRRLESWNILEIVGGDQYKFRHERMPDYVYARSAATRDWSAEDLINDVGFEASRNSILWLTQILGKENPAAEVTLIEELLIDG